MTEQEARAIASRATGLYAAGFISADDVDAKIAEAFAHHRAAVRAETLREVRVTEAMCRAAWEVYPHENMTGEWNAQAYLDWKLTLETALDALAHPEAQ